MATEAMTSAPAVFRPALLDDRRAIRPGDLRHRHHRAARRLVQPARLDLLLVLGGMLLGRWCEFRYGRPLTATGEPATAAHLHRYALVLSILGLGAWLAANLVGNHAIRISAEELGTDDITSTSPCNQAV